MSKVQESVAPPRAACEALFAPTHLGALALANRIVMAPMTRNRADARGVPTPLMAQHYAARAEAGLIVAEGSWPDPEGQAYCRQPGIASDEQVAAWRRVTQAVHERGGRIVLQLMHAGRIGSRHIKGEGVATVGPGDEAARGKVYTDSAGMQPFDTPRALTTEEVRERVAMHARAAWRAREAGFDGVELHATSGYLPMQFLCSRTNRRDDAYGGSVENRVRFAAECLEAMSEAIGADRVGLRINPGNPFNDVADADPAATHARLLRRIAPLGLAYVHVMRAPVEGLDAFALAREHFPGPLILNDGFGAALANEAVTLGRGEAVSFARDFIANPDLVARIRRGEAPRPFDRATLYTPGPEGYL
ncbi:alkene reductase [Halomonas sp. H5]|uniref:alkene reductase n=1 Tax=Halomonas sp. H5 TaxID=3423910 RepID=UPI003D35FB0E